MSLKQINQNEGPGFEEASQQLLLDIAMESSLRELNQMANPSPKPASLSGYYQSLHEWRSPAASEFKN
ncbi:MAG TPA: hypothetical protein DEB48_04585 [Verrucomicrobiales bacterium]|nr:hypothetical protein [Verrucomicrobiales bacterium]HBU59103.1 hypothetical protein [Verrucomicrobiales bacterium]